MAEQPRGIDAVVIGGGFYGAAIAVYLSRQRHLDHVVLVEQNNGLLQRASHNNQARVHGGYHYPRSFPTANRSRRNFPRFVETWNEAVRSDVTSLYAIAAQNSAVTAQQFRRFCRAIDAPLEPASKEVRSLFDSRLIEDVFVVEEYSFDARVLADCARFDLDTCGVDVQLNTRATEISVDGDGFLRVRLRTAAGAESEISSRTVFNCTYSGLNQFGGAFERTVSPLKHEGTEMALVVMPPPLRDLAITVMDGPFFSMVPFGGRNLHTLSHVRYTPHFSWSDAPGIDPYARLAGYERESRFNRMLRDVRRYVPAVSGMRYVDSSFEVKTVLAKNEVDDGRPILFEKHAGLPGLYSILGGKIDNIFDIFERLDQEPLTGEGRLNPKDALAYA